MNEIIEQYIFELTERITRFYLHLDAIREEFYISSDQKVTDKLSFLSSYEECLEKALLALGQQIFILTSADITAEVEAEILRINIILSQQLNQLHESQLGHLPRPSEPVELHRFSRIIDKQVVWLNPNDPSKPNISIYISEKTGEQTYASDPLSEFKSNELNVYLENVNQLIQNNSKGTPIELFKDNMNELMSSNASIHITIPRIDASNPCHWPVLVHEVAHHMLGSVFTSLAIKDSDSLENDFNKFLQDKNIDTKDFQVFCYKSTSPIILRAWLTECWCDLLACMSMGYSYWFAQFAVFINQPSFTHTSDYPPALFRLWLIQRFLKHRFSSDVMNYWEELTTNCEDLLTAYNHQNGYSWLDVPNLRQLLEYFSLYFSSHFFKQKSEQSILPGTINDGLLSVLRYTKDIKLSNIQRLISRLEEGLPIPSIRVLKENEYIERPTSVQEILCAACIYRHTTLKKQVLSELLSLASTASRKQLYVKQEYKNGIEKIVKRFDQAILRSIQVSEWFDLFAIDGDSYPISDLSFKNKSLSGKTLVDYQLVSQILDQKLHIIPIFSLQQQLGSASLDIRLGTSFQLFSPNEYGIIDFASPVVEALGVRSKKRDLDYSESIVIMPNQFILGHSMEYLKLPDHLTAQLEGRSSFARLGIQIHMTAGFVDPGFEGVLTFEIFNAGHSPVRLYPGLRIGQLIFSAVSDPLRPYSTKHSAKYKGLLEHHYSLQGWDYEIFKLRNLLDKNSADLYGR